MLGTYAVAAMTHSWPPTASRMPVVNMFGQFPCVAQRLFSIYKLREGVQYYNKKIAVGGTQSGSTTHLLLMSTSMVVRRTTQSVAVFCPRDLFIQ